MSKNSINARCVYFIFIYLYIIIYMSHVVLCFKVCAAFGCIMWFDVPPAPTLWSPPPHVPTHQFPALCQVAF